MKGGERDRGSEVERVEERGEEEERRQEAGYVGIPCACTHSRLSPVMKESF